MVRMIPIDDPSRIAEVRRAAVAIALEERLDERVTGNAALVSTEISTNLLKHARNGEVFLSALSRRTRPGVEILAVDRGPGIKDLSTSMIDGYSSAQTSGTGLGAIFRLSQEFDIYTEEGKGTVLVSRIGGSAGEVTSVGAVVKPVAGEDVSGDAWAMRESEDALTIVVADGLGHGIEASRASSEAIAAFRRVTDRTPISVLQQIHLALHNTRGAAVAVAYIKLPDRTIRYAGIGNINGVLAPEGKPQFMVSHSGTAGFQMPRLQEFSYSVPASGAVMIMHSDGLTNHWKLDEYSHLRQRHPSVIAGVLYRDATRNRDDVCVVVAKLRGDS